MSIKGTSAPVYVENIGTPPALTRPSFLTMVYPTNVAASQSILFYGRLSPTIDGWQVLISADGEVIFRVWEASSIIAATTAAFFTAKMWHLIVARDVSSTEHRVSAIREDGGIIHAVSTSAADGSGAATAINYAALDGFSDALAYCDSDINLSAGQTDPTLLRKLFEQGPLALPEFRQSIKRKGAYTSFRSKFIGTDPAEMLWGSHAPVDWKPNGAIEMGPECPFTAGWVQPHADDAIVPIYIRDTVASASAALTGTIASSATEGDVRSGGKTLILTVTGDKFVASGATFDAARQAIIDGLDSAQAEAAGWDAIVKAGLPVTAVARTSDTVVTVTLPAFASYNITAIETITATIPAAALVGGNALVASPTFTVAAIAAATISGTATAAIPEAAIVAGGKTVVITVEGDTWVAAGATFDAVRQAIIDGMDSAQAEAHGWDAEVKAKIAVTDVVRTSATVVTVTLDAAAAYDISVLETITVTVPATALTGGNALVASPTFTIYATAAGTGGGRKRGRGMMGVGRLMSR